MRFLPTTFVLDFVFAGSMAQEASSRGPLSSEYGTYKTVTARFWPWLSGKRSLKPLQVFPLRSEAERAYLSESVYGVVLKSLFHHTAVNVSFIVTNMNNKLTDLWGNSLLQNDFINTFCEIRAGGTSSISSIVASSVNLKDRIWVQCLVFSV